MPNTPTKQQLDDIRDALENARMTEYFGTPHGYHGILAGLLAGLGHVVRGGREAILCKALQILEEHADKLR